MVTTKPDAFLSYTRFDDEDGDISAFRQQLSRAVREVSGKSFNIFQDVDDIEGIGLGEHWKDKLDEMLDQARFFIPILTPSFFASPNCRDELKKFLRLERKAGRKDLVLPIYWITCQELEVESLKTENKLARTIGERQLSDWRDLRLRQRRSFQVRQNLQRLGEKIQQAQNRVEKSRRAIAEGKTKPSRRAPPKLRSVSPQPTPSSSRTPFDAFRDIDAPWCPELVLLPAGKLMMGAPDIEENCPSNESPQHEVMISHRFALGRYPITFQEYDHFCEATGRQKPRDERWGRGQNPAIYVDYNDAAAYCAWLSEITERRYHLPSEAQWEYGCRADKMTAYSFGEHLTSHQANFMPHIAQTSEVGSYPANAWGLHDMHGNVWEWCQDCYHRNYKEAPIDGSARLSTNLTSRVIRGGSWVDDVLSARSASRRRSDVRSRSNNIGFRCARVYHPT